MRGGYTLEWNEKIFADGLISKETYLINEKYIRLDDELEKACDELNKHYKNLIKDDLEKAETLDEIELIKNNLIMMPESSSKVWVFRSVILKEEKIKEKINNHEPK